MSLIFRRRVRTGRKIRLNLSRGGVSVSRRAGRVTINSRGQARVRLAKGLFFRAKLW